MPAQECMTCEHHQYYSGGACLCHHSGHQYDEHDDYCIDQVDSREVLDETLRSADDCPGYEKKKWAPYPDDDDADKEKP